MPYPVGTIPSSAWCTLPEQSAVAALEAAAGAAYGANPLAQVVAAPGTQALIQWLPLVFPARRVGILGFTYGEHEACWRAAGAEVTTVTTLADLAGFDTGVVVNPNNPDGRTIAPDDLVAMAGILARRGGRLIVDESFTDVAGQSASVVPRFPAGGALILRSFGKAFGLAGLRLGFALAPAADCLRLRRAIGPWAVSGPAIEIGRRALMDKAWLAETIVRLHHDAQRLDTLLRSAGFAVVGGTPLFRLGSHRQAAAIFQHLGRSGILARPFPENPAWLRFGIPGEPVAWSRLEAALRTIDLPSPAAAGSPGIPPTARP